MARALAAMRRFTASSQLGEAPAGRTSAVGGAAVSSAAGAQDRSRLAGRILAGRRRRARGIMGLQSV
jgi:hypothetical protein